MGRRILKPTPSNDSLGSIIDSYGEHKAQADKLKSVCNNENKAIKNLIMGNNSGYSVSNDKWEAKTDKYKVEITVKHRRTMNEDKLLDVVKEFEIDGIVQTKEYVDMEKLESAIYHGKISKEDLLKIDKCVNITPVPTLKIVKRGK